MNNPLSAARRILQLGEAATPGPWEHTDGDQLRGPLPINGDASLLHGWDDGTAWFRRSEDAAFTVAARSAPEVCEALLRAVEVIKSASIALHSDLNHPISISDRITLCEPEAAHAQIADLLESLEGFLATLDAPVPE